MRFEQVGGTENESNVDDWMVSKQIQVYLPPDVDEELFHLSETGTMLLPFEVYNRLHPVGYWLQAKVWIPIRAFKCHE